MKDFKLEQFPKIEYDYALPNDQYFETLSQKVFEQTVLFSKVVPIYKKPIFWFRLVAASIIIGLMANVFIDYKIMQEDNFYNTVALEASVSIEDIGEQLSENDITILEKNLIKYDKETAEHIQNYL